jgi:hypothetical protein
MHVLTEDELAAIATAYLAVTTTSDAPAQVQSPTRWRLAGRLPDADDQRVRFAATHASRWSAAGRLDD